MPAFNLAWTLYIQLRRCCLHNFQRKAVKVSATAVREGQTLTVGAASNNIIPQVDALFSSLSDIRPAKIPPERRHRCVRKTLCACFTQKTSVILNETQPGLNQYDKNFNVCTGYTQQHRARDWQCNFHIAISLLTQDSWKIAAAHSCSSSLFILTKYPRWQIQGRIEIEEIFRNHCSAAFECKKPFCQVPHSPPASILESSCAQLLTGLLTPHIQQ